MNFYLFFAASSNDLVFKLAELFDVFMTEHQSIEHKIFGNFMGTGFNHVDRICCTGNG